MKNIGFVGLGTMGRPMAGRLLNAGYNLAVYDISADAMRAFEAKGARSMPSPRALAEWADAVMTMLPDAPDVANAYLGKDGLLSGDCAGTYFIDSSTINPQTTRQIGQRAKQVNARLIDAPVGGSSASAATGTLIMLVGGEPADVEACRPLLLTVGERIIHTGPLGCGAALKLANNLISGMLVATLAEGFALADSAGVNIEDLRQLLIANLAKIVPFLTGKMVNQDYSLGFKTSLMHKDMRLALEMALANGLDLPVASLCQNRYKLAIERGLQDEDLTSIYKLVKPPATN